jgi:hypothetical protein
MVDYYMVAEIDNLSYARGEDLPQRELAWTADQYLFSLHFYQEKGLAHECVIVGYCRNVT